MHRSNRYSATALPDTDLPVSFRLTCNGCRKRNTGSVEIFWISDTEFAGFGCGIVPKSFRLEPNQSFTDLMLNGIYRSFRHTHEFKSSGGRTCVTDTVEFTFGLGKMIDRLIGLPTLHRTFEKRHRLLKEWAAQWADYAEDATS